MSSTSVSFHETTELWAITRLAASYSREAESAKVTFNAAETVSKTRTFHTQERIIREIVRIDVGQTRTSTRPTTDVVGAGTVPQKGIRTSTSSPSLTSDRDVDSRTA